MQIKSTGKKAFTSQKIQGSPCSQTVPYQGRLNLVVMSRALELGARGLFLASSCLFMNVRHSVTAIASVTKHNEKRRGGDTASEPCWLGLKWQWERREDLGYF